MPKFTEEVDTPELARLPRILIAVAAVPFIALVVIAVCSVVGR